jgi:4-amino-4-deoxy-L-arabinose transferase
MLTDPFRPMLYTDPIFDYSVSDWTSNHVWLHKPPLFLWQIALSLKLFGTNALAVRMPSILLHALTTLLVFHIGKRTVSAAAGYYGALFFACAYFPLELMAGKFSTDHNDTSFMFYVTASLAAWMEYEVTRKRSWLLLIGLFAGCAVLVKWMAGLLIYGIWFFSIGANGPRHLLSLANYKGIFSALAVTVSITLPWYYYSFARFPNEAALAFKAHALHLVEAVEGHGGDVFFHLRALSDIYGGGFLVPFLVIGGFVMLVIKTQDKRFRWGLLAGVGIVYLVYSLAATKMTSFGTVVSPLFYLGLGCLAQVVISWLEKKGGTRIVHITVASVLLLGTCVLLWKPEKVERYHSFRHPEDNFKRDTDLRQMELIERLKNVSSQSTFALFNADVRVEGHIACMFYLDCAAYGFIPDSKQLETAKAFYQDVVIVDNGELPEKIRLDPEVLVIRL